MVIGYEQVVDVRFKSVKQQSDVAIASCDIGAVYFSSAVMELMEKRECHFGSNSLV